MLSRSAFVLALGFVVPLVSAACATNAAGLVQGTRGYPRLDRRAFRDSECSVAAVRAVRKCSSRSVAKVRQPRELLPGRHWLSLRSRQTVTLAFG
jgi:hypothetical protein